jgi:3',5'-cyclic AMP phosphodiesterase CpdA
MFDTAHSSSRREFLAGTLAAAAGLCLGDRLQAEDRTTDPHRFALLADIHVWAVRDQAHGGVKPAEQFLHARPQVLALGPRPAGLLIAGDCAFLAGKPDDYALLRELTAPITESGIPIHFVMGNHDNREAFWKAFPQQHPGGSGPVADKHVTLVEAADLNWFLLDSLERTKYTPGQLGDAQLHWLAQALDAHGDKPAVVVAHHNLDRAAKTTGLKDTAALLDVLTPRKQVKAYFHGHTHEWAYRNLDGLHVACVPTLVWVFDKTQPRGWVDAHTRSDGMTLKLAALDPTHPAHGQTRDLKWR